MNVRRVLSFATRERLSRDPKRAGRLGSPSHWRTIADPRLEPTLAGYDRTRLPVHTPGSIGAARSRSGFGRWLSLLVIISGHGSPLSLAVVGCRWPLLSFSCRFSTMASPLALSPWRIMNGTIFPLSMHENYKRALSPPLPFYSPQIFSLFSDIPFFFFPSSTSSSSSSSYQESSSSIDLA